MYSMEGSSPSHPLETANNRTRKNRRKELVTFKKR